MIEIEGYRGDLVLSATLRDDLAPVPLTLEATLRPVAGRKVAAGNQIVVNDIPFRIIKCESERNPTSAQGNTSTTVVKLTAIPDALHGLIVRRRDAVIGTNKPFSQLYRACGGAMRVEGDISIGRFAVLIGDAPTFQISTVLQEAGAALAWREKKLALLLIGEMLKQTPVAGIDIESSEGISSNVLGSESVPSYITVSANGTVVSSARGDNAQPVIYAPRKTEQEMAQMRRVLVLRRTVQCQPQPTVRAGDVMMMSGVPMVVITAAHVLQNNTDGAGMQQYSRFWLGVPP